MESSGRGRCVCPPGWEDRGKPGPGAHRLGMGSTQGQVCTRRDSMTCVRVSVRAGHRVSGGRSLPRLRLGPRGWKPPTVGVCTWERCPRIRDSVCPARDTTTFRVQPAGHIRGPTEPILGPTGTAKHGQKATQTVSKLMVSINLDNGTFWSAPGRHRGPFLVIFGHFGPAWAPPRARPLGRPEHFGGQDTGLPGPKVDCLPSQHHPG